jgi:hypothetical protein
MALASNWFHPRHFAFLTGGSMFFAMMCGIAGQAPLALAVEAVGWRNTMMWAAGFALLLSLVVVVVVRNSPSQRTQDEEGDIRWAQIWSGLKKTVRRREVWRLAIVAMAMSGPMLALGGLWGVPFLSSAYGLDRARLRSTPRCRCSAGHWGRRALAGCPTGCACARHANRHLLGPQCCKPCCDCPCAGPATVRHSRRCSSFQALPADAW